MTKKGINNLYKLNDPKKLMPNVYYLIIKLAIIRILLIKLITFTWKLQHLIFTNISLPPLPSL